MHVVRGLCLLRFPSLMGDKSFDDVFFFFFPEFIPYYPDEHPA